MRKGVSNDLWLALEVIEHLVKRGIGVNSYPKYVERANIAILGLVRQNKSSFQDVEAELRQRKFKYIWLQAVPALPLYDCLDVHTKQPKPWCVSVTIGTFEWFKEHELSKGIGTKK